MLTVYQANQGSQSQAARELQASDAQHSVSASGI